MKYEVASVLDQVPTIVAPAVLVTLPVPKIVVLLLWLLSFCLPATKTLLPDTTL